MSEIQRKKQLFFYYFRNAALLHQYLDDALSGAAIPAVGQRGLLPVAGHELLHVLAKQGGIFAHEHVGALLDGLDMLGVAVKGDAGNIVEGGFLSHIAGIGDDTAGMAGEITELEVRQGVDNADAAMTLNELTGTASQRSDDGEVLSGVDNGIEHKTQVLFVSNEGAAVQREHQVTVGGETSGALPALMVGTQRVHEDIAYHIDFVHLGTFARSDTAGANACGEEQVGESVDDKTVDFLGHGDVEGTGACHEMSQPQTVFLGDNSGGHRRGEVVDNDDSMRLMGLKIVFELAHDTSCELVEILAIDTEEDIRTGHLEVAEECGLKRRVVFPARIYQFITTAFGLLDGANQRGNFDEVGAGAGEDANVSHLSEK